MADRSHAKQYAIGILSQNWRVTANKQLVEAIKSCLAQRGACVELAWIPGHCGLAGYLSCRPLSALRAHVTWCRNELADKLATSAYARLATWLVTVLRLELPRARHRERRSRRDVSTLRDSLTKWPSQRQHACLQRRSQTRSAEYACPRRHNESAAPQSHLCPHLQHEA